MVLDELREKRGKLIHDARALLEKAKTEKRNLTSEEDALYERLMKEQDELRGQIAREEKLVELERESATRAACEPQQGGSKPSATTEERQLQGLRNWMRGNAHGDGMQEFRALQADADVSGGFIVTPQQFVAQLIKAVDNEVFIRGLANIIPVPNAQSLGAPSLNTDPDDADWTSELATGSEDSAMAFGKRELTPHPLAKRIKVSNKLLRIGQLNPEGLVMSRLAYKFGVSQEKGFMTGNGSGQPLGLFTASANGISTSRDVSTGNTTTSIQTDGLLEAKYSLKAQYQRTARWIFHRDAVKQIAKLKDGEGQYLWKESVRVGEPDILMGLPFMMSEYAPNTFTTGLYVGILGDYRHYWIADSMTMQMQRLAELYAESNQTGFIGRLETDGMPVLEEAFARVKLA